LGGLYRHRFTPTTATNGFPILNTDSRDGYCVVFCSGESGDDGYRILEFSNHVENVRRQLKLDRRKKKVGRKQRLPCTCHKEGRDCADFESCECRKVGKCLVDCHGDDHTNCRNATSTNQYRIKRKAIDIENEEELFRRKPRARNVLLDDDYITDPSYLEYLSDDELRSSNSNSGSSSSIMDQIIADSNAFDNDNRRYGGTLMEIEMERMK
jgi:hypothetical protein